MSSVLTSKTNLAELKAKQDALDLQKEKLLAKFIPFREALVHELERFLVSAQSNGLHNVRKLRRSKDSKEFVEADFELNNFELVLISSTEVYRQNFDSKDLAAKVFIYVSGDENNTPLLDFIFVEAADTYRILVCWFTLDGPRFIGNIALSEGAEGEAVSILVNHFYMREFAWQDKPTMKAIMEKSGKYPMGFLKE